jgi:hypothetical protein
MKACVKGEGKAFALRSPQRGQVPTQAGSAWAGIYVAQAPHSSTNAFRRERWASSPLLIFSTVFHSPPVTDNLYREYGKRIVELCAGKLPIRTARGSFKGRMQFAKIIS